MNDRYIDETKQALLQLENLKSIKETRLIEHEGLMIEPAYQRTFLNKVNGYLTEGIIPGRDVFFTFDDLKGGFDPSPVQDIIDTRLKPRS